MNDDAIAAEEDVEAADEAALAEIENDDDDEIKAADVDEDEIDAELAEELGEEEEAAEDEEVCPWHHIALALVLCNDWCEPHLPYAREMFCPEGADCDGCWAAQVSQSPQYVPGKRGWNAFNQGNHEIGHTAGVLQTCRQCAPWTVLSAVA